MKKIMFNDKYGLTQAVLEGRKTQTRRLELNHLHELALVQHLGYNVCGNQAIINCHGGVMEAVLRYRLGEIVAVTQSYSTINDQQHLEENFPSYYFSMSDKAGWRNKMYVKADLMPYRIEITGIRLERLQDISDEDCLAEGIESEICYDLIPVTTLYTYPNAGKWFASPREAYASLIDNISGKGTWESNPWVVVYDFELIK